YTCPSPPTGPRPDQGHPPPPPDAAGRPHPAAAVRAGRGRARARARTPPPPPAPADARDPGAAPARARRPAHTRRARPAPAPTRPSARPTKIMVIALATDPCARTTDASRPSTISEKYSAELKLSAIRVSIGPATAMKTVATVPAKKDPSAAVASAAPPRPCWA